MNHCKDHNIGKYNFFHFANLSYSQKIELLRWRNDNSIRKWMYNDKIIQEQDHLMFIERLKTTIDKLYFLVLHENIEIGVVYFDKIDFNKKTAYLGIYKKIDSPIAGSGKFLINGLLELASKALGLVELKLEVLENNEQAINFYKKNNFIEEGRIKKHICRDNQWLDVIVMGKTIK